MWRSLHIIEERPTLSLLEQPNNVKQRNFHSIKMFNTARIQAADYLGSLDENSWIEFKY